MAIIFVLIFIIGIFFGSFSTLALYRIPLKMNITHERSFCPNCNHKLGALDLVPLLSYVFLGGKCRYCKEKISPRYFCIELLFGMIAILFFGLVLKISGGIDVFSLFYFLGVMIIFEVLFLFIGVLLKKKM